MKIQQKLVPLKEMNACKICFENTEVVNLTCKHSFCKQCLKQCVNFKQLSDLNEIKCPICQFKIDDKILEQFSEIKQKLLDNQYILGMKSDEILIQCLNDECKKELIIWKESDFYTCCYCDKKYCLKCKKLYHENKTCIENIKLLQITKSQLQFFKGAYKQNSYQICPHCLNVVEKTSGCNFITCKSKICKSKKYFCYKCGEPLKEEEKSQHYVDSVFRGECKIKVNGEWYEKDNIPQNNFTCPGCQTTDPLICKLEDNFDYNFIFCNSSKCKGKTYCAKCSIIINDQNIMEHLNNEHDQEQIQQKQGIFGSIVSLVKRSIKKLN